MAKYRKKPVVIEAIQFTNNPDEIQDFVGVQSEVSSVGKLVIHTLEGDMEASKNDWVIKGEAVFGADGALVGGGADIVAGMAVIF